MQEYRWLHQPTSVTTLFLKYLNFTLILQPSHQKITFQYVIYNNSHKGMQLAVFHKIQKYTNRSIQDQKKDKKLWRKLSRHFEMSLPGGTDNISDGFLLSWCLREPVQFKLHNNKELISFIQPISRLKPETDESRLLRAAGWALQTPV